MEVEGEGRIILAMVDEIEDVIFILETAFNKEGSGDEGFSVENGSVHDRRGLVVKKAVWLDCEFR
jgi:hypothetical protein